MLVIDVALWLQIEKIIFQPLQTSHFAEAKEDKQTKSLYLFFKWQIVPFLKILKELDHYGVTNLYISILSLV